MTSLLTQARLYWALGRVIPVDIAMQLTAYGYDVPALEAKYRKY